jgi:hypothetical protein
MKKIALVLSILLSGCATVRESYPSRTATEQMLISEATEDAARQLVVAIPANRLCYLDTTNFEGVDAKYAVSAIRQQLMIKGLAVIESRERADTIIEIRAGALSIDSKGRSLSIPGLKLNGILPIFNEPLSITQMSKKTDQGIAKFSAFAYDKATGRLIVVAQTVEGRSIRSRVGGELLVVKR